MKYIPGLNGLRALAVIFVVISHWEPPSDLFRFYHLLPDGKYGVNLFFVLSGFLISSILFIEKKRMSNANPPRKVIVNFYIRRFLRIFPVYYLTLFIIYLFHIRAFDQDLPFYLTYTSNFHSFFQNNFGFFGHAWSLAVEEQFYLIWPFLIIFLSKRLVLRLLPFFILIGPLSSFMTSFFKGSFNAYILTPQCFDSFGIGAFIAYYYTEDNLGTVKKWVKRLLPLSIICYLYWKLAPQGGHFQYMRRFFESITAAGLILFCLSGKQKLQRIRDVVLENKILSQIGIVSYGIYLFHYTLPYFYLKAKASFGLQANIIYNLSDYVVLSVILLALSFTSYYFFEKPILSLKSRFKY